MNSEQFERSLKSFQKPKHFKPYLLIFKDGDFIKVDHPEALVTRSGTAVYFAPDGTPMLFDADSVSRFTYPAVEKAAS